MHETTTVVVETTHDFKIENAVFTLYNTLGVAVETQKFTANTLTLSRNDLAAGCYFYVITVEKDITNSGKIIIE